MSRPVYDTVVIGSGAGGLAAAVALAQAGLKVLVCEQHEVPGGWTHSFTLEGYRFNTGVHYIGELGEGERLRRIYEGLGVSRDLAFLELNPDGYDHIFIGNEKFDIPRGKEAYIARLKDRFPQETSGIDRLFQKISDLYWVLVKIVDGEWLSVLRRPTALPWFARSGGSLIDHYVENPLLRAVLTAQSGDHGMPPSRVSAAIHAAVIHHYFEGGYHPRGGGMTIARAFVRALERAGGEIRLRTPVQHILLDGRRAVGVQLPGAEILHARHIISNADPEMTFGRLIGREHLSPRLRRKLDRVGYSTSCLSLYLAVDCDLKAMGLDSGNYWIYEHADVDRIYRQGLTDYATRHPPPVLFVTVTTLKDPGKMHRGHHQLEVFTFVGYDAFARWEDQPSGERDAEYQQLKTRITQRMLTVLDRHFPGIKDAVVFRNLATPLTNAHYIKAHRGNMYGIDKGVWQAGPLGFRSRTEFKDLYLCGASTMANGIAYATNTGLTAAARILRCHPRDLLRQDGPELRIYPCDDLNQWPEHLRRRIERGTIRQ
jgi:all-trans-retinol 13,14-reductase